MGQLGGWGMNQPSHWQQLHSQLLLHFTQPRRSGAVLFHMITASSSQAQIPVPALSLWVHYLSLSEPQCPHL